MGRAIARGFLEHCGEVRVHDVVPERSTHSLAQALDCDFTFVCVPTPAKPDGTCDTSHVEDVLAAADSWGRLAEKTPRLVIKSTVPVGFTRKSFHRFTGVEALHSPEFLTQRCAQVDFQTPARNIVGVPGYSRHGSASAAERAVYDAGQELARLYRARFPGVPCLTMSSDESELVKLAQNSFFMAKVAFFNLVYQVAQATGADFERVRAGMLADGRIAHAHTAVPGPDGKLGAGGACLVKDTADLYRTALEAGLHPDSGPNVLAEILRFNAEIRAHLDPEMTQVRI